MRQMTQSRLTELFDKARNTNSGKEEFTEIYTELQLSGFQYAGWGLGVVTKETLTGVSAVNYMNSTSPTGEDFTYNQEVEVNRQMVLGYGFQPNKHNAQVYFA